MRFLRDLPIRRKLLCVTLLTCGPALALACSALFWFQSVQFREAFAAELESLATVVAQNSAAPLAFGDEKSAHEVLSTLGVRSHITSASVFDPTGKAFASYGSEAEPTETLSEGEAGRVTFSGGYARVKVSIPVQDGNPGWLQVRARFGDKHGELVALYGILLLSVLVGSVIVIVIVASAMQGVITEPIDALAEAARRVSESRDYTARVPETGRDEVGLFTRTFNEMLDQLQRRDADLKQAQAELEDRVERRTRELSVANANLNREIVERKAAERRLAAAFDGLEAKVVERTQELREAKSAAEAASGAKSRFLAMMSHEIRTPLNGVTGMLHLLLRDQPAPRQRRWIDMAQAAAETLLRVINDVLDFSKVEAGKLDLRPVPSDVRDTVRKAVGVFASRATEKGLAWEVRIDSRVPVRVMADADRVAQVLSNLVGNAVKFTDSGGVRLEVTLAAASDGHAEVRFEVRDSGPGLSAEDQESLFQPFSQVDNSSTRRHGGTGLGLGICKQLVELMGGRLGVISAIGSGSTFWFEIPLPTVSDTAGVEPPKAEAEAEVPRAAEGRDLARIRCRNGRVLVAEDNEINQELAQEMIRMCGCECRCVGTGQEAVELAAEGGFGLVFMDCMMPGTDGYGATRAIRAAEDARRAGGEITFRIPIVAMTANAMEGDREVCLAAGMDDYLSKPLDPDQVAAMLAKWLIPDRGGRSDEVSRTSRGVTPPESGFEDESGMS